MRITFDTICRLAADADTALRTWADRRSLGTQDQRYGEVTHTTNMADDPVYRAAHSNRVWSGQYAALQAAAYYLGIADAIRATAYHGLAGDGLLRHPFTTPVDVREHLSDRWSQLSRDYGEGLDEGNRAKRAYSSTPSPNTYHYERDQLTRVLDGGPNDNETWFRLQVQGRESSKLLSITPEQLSTLIEALWPEREEEEQR